MDITSDHFNSDYLYFHESIHHDKRNARQVEFIWEKLSLEEGFHLLDVPCGFGRISNALARRGCNVIGIDINDEYLTRAQSDASSSRNSASYIHQDMRFLPWKEQFDALLCWYISFGYYDDITDQAILREFHKVLKPGGRILLELVYLPGFIRSLSLNSKSIGVSHRFDDVMVIETFFDPVVSRNYVNRTIIRDGKKSVSKWSVRFFTCTEIKEWLLIAGFKDICFCNRNGEELALSDDRMFITAVAQGTESYHD